MSDSLKMFSKDGSKTEEESRMTCVVLPNWPEKEFSDEELLDFDLPLTLGMSISSSTSTPSDELSRTYDPRQFDEKDWVEIHEESIKVIERIKRNYEMGESTSAPSFPSLKSPCTRPSGLVKPGFSLKKAQASTGTETSKKVKRMSASISTQSPSTKSSTSSVMSSDLPTLSSTNERPSSSIPRSKKGSLGEINDKSPSSMMSKRPLVLNTPIRPQKEKVSEWSPIKRKRPIDRLEEATRCTKKFFK